MSTNRYKNFVGRFSKLQSSRARRRLAPAALSVCGGLLATATLAHAGQQYLDLNGVSAGYGTAPASGVTNWDSTNAVWTPNGGLTDGTATPSTWVDGNDALLNVASTNALNLNADGSVNPKSVQVLTAQATVNIGSSNNSLLTLGSAAGNNGIFTSNGDVLSFNSNVASGAVVNISCGTVAAYGSNNAVVNFGNIGYTVNNNFSGGINLTTASMRVNFNNTNASGNALANTDGPISIYAPDVTITNANTVASNASNPAVITIPNSIIINPNNINPYNSQHQWGFYASLSSTTFAGSTAAGYMNFSGQISGNGVGSGLHTVVDGGVIIGNADFTSGGGNNITVFSNSNNNYSGATIIGMTGGKFPVASTSYGVSSLVSYGSLRLGADNALPKTTDVIFGLPNVSKVYGSVDLNGHNVTVNSISNTYLYPSSVAGQVTPYSFFQPGTEVFAGVANDTPTPSTLTIQSSYNPQYQFGNVPYVLDAPIGVNAATYGDSTLAAAGSPTGTNAIAVVYNSPATWELGAISTYTGGTTIENGTIALADTFTTGGVIPGGLSPAGTLTFGIVNYNGANTSGGTLDLAGQNQTVAGLISTGGAGTVTNSGANVTFTANIASGANTFSGVIADGSGTIAFTKSGAGSLTLTGTHTYAGPTTISGGSLIVNGSIAAGSAVTVGPNSVLGGNGTIFGNVTVQAGGTLAPGQLAPLNIGGNLTLQPVSELQFTLNAPTGPNDSVNVSAGSLNFQTGNPVGVQVANGGSLAAGTYHLISFASDNGGTSTSLRLSPLPLGYSGQLVLTGSSLDLDVSTVTPKYWTNAAGTGNWNTTDANFTPSNYVDATATVLGDSVVFSDNASSGMVNISSAISPQSITFTNTAAGLSYQLGGAAITGTSSNSSSISITGGGSVTLTGSNSFVGLVQDSYGTLNISADNNLGNSSNPVVLAAATTPAVLAVTANISSGREIILNGAGTISVGSGLTFTANGPLESSGSLIKAGAGTLVLNSASDSYGGSTNISAGTVLAGATNVIPAGSDLTIGTGATFNTANYGQTVASLSGAGNLMLGSGVTLTTAGTASTTFSGTISGPGTLTLGGTGVFNLSGGNTFGGAGQTVTLNAGELVLNSDSNLGNVSNGVSLASGSTLALNTSSFSTARAIALTYSGNANPVPPTNILLFGKQTSTLSGNISGNGGLSVSGSGVLALSGSNTFQGGLTINGIVNGGTPTTAAVSAASAAALGSGPINFINGGILLVTGNIPASNPISNTINILGNGGTFNTGANTVVVTGQIIGLQATGVTKVGTGTLILSTTQGSTYSGAWTITTGTVEVNSDDSSGFVTGIGTDGNDTGGLLPVNSITVGVSGTFAIANATFGDYTGIVTSRRVYLNAAGASLMGMGNAKYGYQGGGLYVTKGTSSAITAVNLKTASASDTLTIENEVLQYDSTNLNSGVTNALITVSGPGKVVLQGGDVNGFNDHNNSTAPNADYAGSWQVSSGILQLGPVQGQANPQGVGGLPYGEPLNALGFVNGDPEQANPITLKGGILALGVDAPNTNPGYTGNTSIGVPANPTPNYLRSPVTLSGGALASTGFEVAYNTANPASAQGVATTTLVSAQFGGNFNVASGATSYIDTFDPSAPATPMSVELVGGNRNVSTGNYNYTTTWGGTLSINPGNTTGGSFDITRTAGTINVSSGASVIVQANSTLNVGTATISGAKTPISGVIDPFTASSSVGNSTALSVGLVVAGTLDYTTGTGDAIASTSFKLDRLASLNVSTGGQVTINTAASQSTRSLLVTGSLTVTGTGSINLNNNDMIVQGTSLSTVNGLVAQAYNGGLWNGSGVTSAVAANDTTHLTALGVIQNNQSGSALYGSGHLFDGTNPAASDVLIKYTYYGDANLDGSVTSADYTLIDGGFLSNGTLTGWQNGDFNYDHVINGSDYTLIDNAFNTQGASLASVIANPGASIAAEIAGTPASSAVPEPTSLGLLGVSIIGLLGRRRRSR